ncbi:unnamed protein product [Meloidogyne enterolobii]|uniref:Uncharacterized protein n=1 Tax=Meloidogyne enterolobii TaxID=390850 RepID=A0ACB1AAE1_MELEN
MSLYKEDVYETEDLPEPELDDNEEYFENKEIEKVHVDLNAAKRRFGNCLLDSGGADFSDSVTSSRLKRGYKANEIFEGSPQDWEIEELTFEQKYKKICSEIKELMAESEKQTQPVSKTEIEGLHKFVQSIASPAVSDVQPKTSDDSSKQVDEPKYLTEEDIEKYRSKLVSGASIQEFNEVINAILAEYNRIAKYCSSVTKNRKEYFDYLQKSHQSALNFKDKQIQLLESTVEQLRQDLVKKLRNEHMEIARSSVKGETTKEKNSDVG